MTSTRSLSLGLILLVSTLYCGAARAEIPPRLEPEYAEAVLAFNAREFKKALSVLEDLTKRYPETTEFLELHALALKGDGRQNEAVQLYQKLIELKTRDKADPEEIAPYYFELGVLRFREGKYDEAEDLLSKAAEEDFNEGASHFFLGLIQFKAGRWGGSEGHFSEVASSNSDDLKPAPHFYLAQLSMKTNYATGATYNLIHARDWAETLIEDENTGKDARAIATQIQAAAAKALEPLDKSQTYGNLALLLAYDSNVLAQPETDGGATDVSALKAMAQVSLGMVSSPLRKFQFAPNFRGSVPIHFGENRATTRNGEYTPYSLSIPVTLEPLAPVSFAIKPEVGYTFQNQIDGAGLVDYKPFHVKYGVTPSMRWEIGPKKIVGIEAGITYNNYLVNLSGENVRDGLYYRARLYYKNDVGRRFLNPTVSFTYSEDVTYGSNFRGTSYSPEISNLMYLNEKLILGQSFTYRPANYPDYFDAISFDHEREDTYFAFQATGTYRLTPKITLLGEIKVEHNDSDIEDVFKYDRTVLSTGVSYSL